MCYRWTVDKAPGLTYSVHRGGRNASDVPDVLSFMTNFLFDQQRETYNNKFYRQGAPVSKPTYVLSVGNVKTCP